MLETLVVVLSLAVCGLTAAVVKLWELKVEDARRRELRGDVVKNFETWAKMPEVAAELRASCDLAMAEIVKGSIRARTVEGMAYREGAFDALSVLKRHFGKESTERKLR